MLDLCYIKTFCSSVKFLMLYSCLAALRRSYSDASERDYRSTVTNWLDGSKDRNGGRKKDVPNVMQLPGMTLTVQKKIITLVYLSWLRFLMEIFASFLI